MILSGFLSFARGCRLGYLPSHTMLCWEELQKASSNLSLWIFTLYGGILNVMFLNGTLKVTVTTKFLINASVPTWDTRLCCSWNIFRSVSFKLFLMPVKWSFLIWECQCVYSVIHCINLLILKESVCGNLKLVWELVAWNWNKSVGVPTQNVAWYWEAVV